MDLSTTYLGLRLAHPFMVGASPLVDHLDTVRRLEDGGSAAIVLHSLFEEQITLAHTGKAGAHAVQMVSAILRHGPPYFIAMREGLARWMESKQFTSLTDVRGRVSLAHNTDPATLERANYIRTLQSWTTEA